MKTLVKVCILLLILSFNAPSFSAIAQTDVRVITTVAWSPDGETLAIGGRATNEQGAIWLYDDTGAAIDTIYLPGTVYNVRWSRDGARLAARYDAGGGTQLAIWDWEAPKAGAASVTTEKLLGVSDNYRIAWSPTGRYIAANGSVWVYVIDTATGGPIAQLYDEERTGTGGAVDVKWAADEQSLYVLYDARDANQFLQWDINTTQVVQTVLSGDAYTFPLTMQQSPNGQWLAVSVSLGSVFLLSVPDLKVEQELFVQQGDSTTPYAAKLFWLGDNASLLGLAYDGSAYLWDTVTGELIAVDNLIPDERTYLRDVALTPFGGRLAIATTWYPETPASTPPYEPTTYQPFLLGGMVRITVPAPSFDRLNATAELCVQDAAAPIESLDALTAHPVTESTLLDFVVSVESLPDHAIPPACRADLLAVAEALQSDD